MPPKQDSDRRKQILSAAMECVAELGYDGATMREIARRAKISTGGLTYYYPTKVDLITDALETARNYGRELRDGLVGADPTPRRVDALFKSLLTERHPESGPWAFWIECWSEAIRRPELGPDKMFLRGHDVIRKSLEAGIKDGVFAKDLDTELTTLVLHSMMIGLGIETTLDGQALPPERALEACRLALSLLSVSPD